MKMLTFGLLMDISVSFHMSLLGKENKGTYCTPV